jgi:hypothetical protein
LIAVSLDHATPSAEALDQGLKSYLAAQLWNQNFDMNRTEKDMQGTVLLASYMDVVINSAVSTSTVENDPNPSLMRMNVDYTGLVLTDRARYFTIENDALEAFMKANPAYTLVTKVYTYTPTVNDLIKVTALFTFSSQK